VNDILILLVGSAKS